MEKKKKIVLLCAIAAVIVVIGVVLCVVLLNIQPSDQDQPADVNTSNGCRILTSSRRNLWNPLRKKERN